MPYSVYDVCVPQYRQILGAFVGVLDKAAAHDAAGETLTECKLADDMLPFSVQAGLVVFHSAGAVARLRGEDYPRAEGLETLAGCKAAVTAALAYLEAVKPADLEGAETRDITLSFPQHTLAFTGSDYLLSFALPNFYFHVTTAYAILRHKGVAIGKLDFLGAVRFKG